MYEYLARVLVKLYYFWCVTECMIESMNSILNPIHSLYVSKSIPFSLNPFNLFIFLTPRQHYLTTQMKEIIIIVIKFSYEEPV